MDWRAIDKDLAHRLLSLLRGQDPGLRAAVDDELRRQVREGGPLTDRALRTLHRHVALPLCVRRAVAIDRQPIVLTDGSTLELDDAERILAEKEQARVFSPLRERIADARDSAMRRTDSAPSLDEFAETLEVPRSDCAVPTLDDEVELLGKMLIATRPLLWAARELLESVGGVAAGDGDSVNRLLDLPESTGALTTTRAFALLKPLAQRLPSPPKRMRAPRAMAGHALLTDHAVAMATPARRTAGFLANAQAGSQAIGASLFGELSTSSRSAGHAIAFAVCGADHRRAVLDEPRRRAEEIARVALATAFLRWGLRTAAICAALSEHGERDAMIESQLELVGLVFEPQGTDTWPDGDALRHRWRVAVDDSLAWMGGVAAHLRLRDALDSGWATRRQALEAMRDICTAPISADDVDDALSFFAEHL